VLQWAAKEVRALDPRRAIAGLLLAGALSPAAEARAGVALVSRTETCGGSGMCVEDPSGIAGLPGGGFALVDGDAERSPRFRGESLWEVDLAGRKTLRAADLTGFTAEPSDVAWCEPLGALLVTDDDEIRLHVLSRSGEPRTAIDLAELGARDPEGVACAPEPGRVFVADGRGREILELTPEGRLVGRVELSELPVESAEGIAWDPEADHLLLLDDDPPTLFELTRDGSLVAGYDLVALGLVRPRGVALAPASDGRGTSVYVVDAGEMHEPDGRVFEVSRAHRPTGARVRTQLVGDVDGFGFRGDEPGFAAGDLDRDGLLEPGERLPAGATGPSPRDADDPPGTDAAVLVAEGRPLGLEHVLALGSGVPVWARLTLRVGGARALGGRRSAVRADGHLLGEVVPTRGRRLYPGMIGDTVLELPPAALRDLRDGRLRVEIARDPGTGSDEIVVDFSRLEVAIAESAPPEHRPVAPKQGGGS
jgi:hypothetical protein